MMWLWLIPAYLVIGILFVRGGNKKPGNQETRLFSIAVALLWPLLIVYAVLFVWGGPFIDFIFKSRSN